MDSSGDRNHHRVASSTTAWEPSSPVSPLPRESSLSRRSSWGRSDGLVPAAESIVPAAMRSSDGTLSPIFTEIPMRSPSPSPVRPFHHTQSQISLETTEFIIDEDEDRTHLTAPGFDDDPEGDISRDGVRRRSPRRSPRSKDRHAHRTSVGGSAIKAMSNAMRRASVRVVNFAGTRADDQPVRLQDGPDEDVEVRVEGVKDEEPPPVYDSHERLRGRTLGICGPNNKLRKAMHDFLLWRWTEPTILLLIIAYVVILTIEAVPDVYTHPRPTGYFKCWEDFALFALFVIFTLEAFARIIVSGFIIDPETPISALWAPFPDLPDLAFQTRIERLRARFKRAVALPHRSPKIPQSATQPSTNEKHEKPPVPPLLSQAPSFSDVRPKLRLDGAPKATFVDGLKSIERPFEAAVRRQNFLSLQSRPYLRHAWTRIDFVAVVSFWIMFVLAITNTEATPSQHIFIFRALSVLRAARLLTITTGTTTILNSLKRAGPLLVNVAFFVLFAMILFSIIGVQSFRGNYRRSCVLLLPEEINGNLNISTGQICGGQVDRETLNATGYYDVNLLQVAAADPKGYICPIGSICQEQPQNPQNGSQSFDNVLASAMQVVVVASANTWSTVMYNMMDADFFVSCLFFIVCIIVLNFWLINMFVAVITNSFAATRAETRMSAFGADIPAPVLNEGRDDGWPTFDGRKPTTNLIRKTYETIKPGFVVAILASLVVQATRTAEMTTAKAALLDACEMAFTFIFDFEILWRLVGYFPNWRAFFRPAENVVDTTLALVSSIIQIPGIHNSRVYAWLTIFQIARSYRVILAIPRMRRLLLQVFGSVVGLANMSLFLVLTNFIGALIAVQLFRGDIPGGSNTPMTFNQMSIAFLGMYQITSSENWTDVLYDVLSQEAAVRQLVISALFLCFWFLFANFIMLQMFIAVINENFSIAEEQKRAEQLAAYVRKQTEPKDSSVSWLDQWNPYRFMKPAPRAITVDTLPANLVLPMRKALVRDNYGVRVTHKGNPQIPQAVTGFVGSVRQFFAMEEQSEELPLDTLRGANRDSIFFGEADELGGTERQFDVPGLNTTDAPQATADALYEQRAQKADFILEHPSYDKSLWLFSQSNPVRQFCQTLVIPANGERVFGTAPSPLRQTVFQVILFLAVIGGIAVAGIATPSYRRQFRLTHGLFRGSWFEVAETAFALALVGEFVVKIIADGFVFSPNAYLLSIWNVVDFVILIVLLVNVVTGLVVVGGINRATRALKAFRALRLITLTGRTRETFHMVIFAGAMRIVDAALLAVLYMIPYAIWGLNMFAGLLFSCNDGSVNGKATCYDEYSSDPLSTNSTLVFLAPRSWANPSTSTSWSFDNFGSSLLILFETVSLEGWIDVLIQGMAITGLDQQLQTNASEVNAIYFVIYNLMGAVVVLTLFVSIIISNFSNQSGVALLTAQQREWIDLQKLIRRQRPSRRPEIRPTTPVRKWCFDRAVQKHGWWSRGMTVLYVFHICGLMTETFQDYTVYAQFQNVFFLVLSLCYTVDIVVRLTGLGWKSFRMNGWNLFDVFVVAGSFATTVPALLGSTEYAVLQLQKLFLVSIAFKLVQKNDSLNQLFKTSVASLPAIGNLFLLWLTLFMFFAILFIEVFGLTRWVSGETPNVNFSSFGNALVMLSFMSTGEGWNQFMHDYAVTYPRCTNSSPTDPDSDCGSVGWAFSLFIAWNILSMYIFVNMFTGVVVESFSYVFQLNGKSAITRDEMRAFKDVWAEFDPERSGRLHRKDFVRFFSKLTGVFEVEIYPARYRVQAILDASRANDELAKAKFEHIVGSLDLRKLRTTLDSMDLKDIHRRRVRYNRLYHEAILADKANNLQGISFTDMLIMLAHYNLISDENALRLEETIKRQTVLERVTDRVNLDRVHSMLRTIIYRRKFVASRETELQRRRAEEQGIPAIVVESSPATPPLTSRDLGDGRELYHGEGLDSPLQSPSFRTYSPDPRFSISPSPSPARHDRRASDISMLSADLAGSPSPRNSQFFDESATQQVISSLSSSIWGEMMQEAEEED